MVYVVFLGAKHDFLRSHLSTVCLGSKHGLQYFTWGQSTIGNVLLGSKHGLYTFLGFKVQFSNISLVQSLLYKFSRGVKVLTVCNVFHGVKVGLDLSSGIESSLYISGPRMYCMISYLFLLLQKILWV